MEKFFFETPPQNRTKMSFFVDFFTYSYKSWCGSFQKNKVSTFRCHLGCTLYTQSWVFFQNVQNTAFWLLYYSASKKATAMVFIWGERGYPAARFDTKRALSDIWLPSCEQSSFGCFLKKFKLWVYSKTPKTILLISQQPNIATRPICIQNERQDILFHLI